MRTHTQEGLMIFRRKSWLMFGALFVATGISFHTPVNNAAAQTLVANSTSRATSRATSRPVQLASTQYDEVLVIQRLLSAVGFSVGPINGELTRQTREAIRSFQRQNSMRVNGRVTLTLMTFLTAHALDYFPEGDTEEVLDASSRADPQIDFNDRANVALVQRILARHGFGPGRIDGRFGFYTSQAILNFQAKMDLDETGELSFELLSALGDYDKRR